MKTQTTELQLHEAELIDNVVRVDYSLVDDEGESNVKQDIPVGLLIDFIEDNGFNEIYNYDEYYHLNANIYLYDTLRKTVTLYLEDQLCA